MSLSDYKLTDAEVARNGVVAAPDKLTGTAAQNKALFDRLIRETVKVLYNGLIDELSGNGGAENIGVDGIEGLTAQNVQHALAELAAKLFSLDASDVGVEAQLAVIQPENVSDALVQICDTLDSYQLPLTFDSAPTAGSSNPVTSAGIKTALDGHYVAAGRKNGTTLGNYATAEGRNTTASANYAHAEGLKAAASANGAHAEGSDTTASGVAAHAEGSYAAASGYGSHAEGSATAASGNSAHSEGEATAASGMNAHAEGKNTIANHFCQHVFGSYNVEDPSTQVATLRGNYVEIVGNGTSSARSNARTLDWSGNETLAGKLTLGAAPTDNMDAATKKYVDDAIAAAIAALGT